MNDTELAKIVTSLLDRPVAFPRAERELDRPGSPIDRKRELTDTRPYGEFAAVFSFKTSAWRGS